MMPRIASSLRASLRMPSSRSWRSRSYRHRDDSEPKVKPTRPPEEMMKAYLAAVQCGGTERISVDREGRKDEG